MDTVTHIQGALVNNMATRPASPTAAHKFKKSLLQKGAEKLNGREIRDETKLSLEDSKVLPATKTLKQKVADIFIAILVVLTLPAVLLIDWARNRKHSTETCKAVVLYKSSDNEVGKVKDIAQEQLHKKEETLALKDIPLYRNPDVMESEF
jgi:hypothetical protein